MTETEGDAVEHLWNAAHEFLQALRGLIDAADEFVEEQRTKVRDDTAASPRLRRIDIDVS
ncbi:MAG TPA: hypothetical protein VFR41_08790 [Acidimicrobiia bacterium]|nr:hypothetical protein [Acidimicrobiia bacterium]